MVYTVLKMLTWAVNFISGSIVKNNATWSMIYFCYLTWSNEKQTENKTEYCHTRLYKDGCPGRKPELLLCYFTSVNVFARIFISQKDLCQCTETTLIKICTLC